jgi:glucosyl-3-phosphoglycerate synthase
MTLSAPDSTLRVCVVVPAREEEALIASCLEALATQERVAHDEYEVLLILDRCTDRTETRARKVVATHPSLRLHFLDGPGEGS